MPYCPDCGSRVQEEDAFCSDCGRSLPHASSSRDGREDSTERAAAGRRDDSQRRTGPDQTSEAERQSSPTPDHSGTGRRRRAVLAGVAGLAVLGGGGYLALESGILGGTNCKETPPEARFVREYDSTAGMNAGELTIRHAGGDPIPADELYLKGDGFIATASPSDMGTGSISSEQIVADQFAAGAWEGESSQGQVTEGDAVVVGVVEPNSVQVVWETETCRTVLSPG